MTLRILHIGKYFPPHHGGMEVFLANLMDAQRKQGIQAFALVHGTPLADDPDWLIRVPVQAQLLYAPISLGFRSAINRAIERFRPHVLHLHMPNNAVFWCLTLPMTKRIPWVVHWHSDVVVSQIRVAIRLAYRFYRPFEQAILDHAERIIVTSPPYLDASEPLAAWRDKCSVVPLGLSTIKTTLNPQKKPFDLPWRGNKLRLLSIGRLTYYKGFSTLIRAVHGLPDIELIIVGNGELHQELLSLIQELDHINMNSNTNKNTNQNSDIDIHSNIQLLTAVSDDEKNELLSSCDIFCLASIERTEAFGMVLLEAMNHARPCIVSDLPHSGMPWLIQEAGAGLLTPLQNIKAWRESILKLKDDPVLRKKLGQAGQRALYAHFSIEVCTQAMTSQYHLTERIIDNPEKHVLILISTKNSALTIKNLIEQLHEANWHDLVVIDDESQDNTIEIARQTNTLVLCPVLAVGSWGAIQTGFRYALSKGYQKVITLNANESHLIDCIPFLLKESKCSNEHLNQSSTLYSNDFLNKNNAFSKSIESQTDVVIGTLSNQNTILNRYKWTVRWFRLLSGFKLRDLMSSFRCYNRAAMQVLASVEASSLDYQDVGTLLMIRRAGLQISEIEISLSEKNQLNQNQNQQLPLFRSWYGITRYVVLTSLLCLTKRPF